MNTYTYKSLLNKKNEYSTFEIPEEISFTRKLKTIKAKIDFSLVYSEDSSEAGQVCFEKIEDAKKVLSLNKNRDGVKALSLSLRINNEWYKEDGVTLVYPKKTTIWDVKKELKITDADIAEMFGFANANSYATSSAKKRYETGLVNFYKKIKNLEDC